MTQPSPSAAKERKPRLTYHHGDLDRALRDATIAILGEVGAERFTLREAARRAGVNHRAVYRHFADKRALLAAVSEEGYRQLADAMRGAIADATDPIDRLVRVAEGYVRFARREPARYEVMFGPRLNLDGRFPALETAISDAVHVLRVELKGAAPDVTSIARRDAGIALWSSVHGFSALVLGGRVALKDRHVARYVDTLFRPIALGIVASLRGA
jgi:AcrR family transcriptional regulator